MKKKLTFLYADEGEFVWSAGNHEELPLEIALQSEFAFTTYSVIREGQVRFTEVLSHD